MRHEFDKALRGDFWDFIKRQRYHLTLYDVFEYITHHDYYDEDVGRWAGRLSKLLILGGIVCLPILISMHRLKRRLRDSSDCVATSFALPLTYWRMEGETGIFECWQRKRVPVSRSNRN
jgi:hypothetical protein